MQDKTPIIVVAGPTAAGKTATALQACQVCGEMEIVSADSRQIFRQMNIGTAKPSTAQLKQHPHHCIDIKDPDEAFSAGEFGRVGLRICREIIARGRVPLVVGGSGLYIRSLTDGLFPGGPRDPQTKSRLEERADREGLQAQYDKLVQVDSVSAARIHPNDRQRILRALEVWETHGRPLSELQKAGRASAQVQAIFVGIGRSRGRLYERINARVAAMLDAGLVHEVEALRGKGFGSDLQSQQTVGYQEIHRFLDGEYDLAAAGELIMRNTRRFAKRQITWFSREPGYQWFDLDNDQDGKRAVSHIESSARTLLRELFG